jgi:hypothetical protein
MAAKRRMKIRIVTMAMAGCVSRAGRPGSSPLRGGREVG